MTRLPKKMKKKKKKKIKSCGPRIDAYGSPNSMSGQLL